VGSQQEAVFKRVNELRGVQYGYVKQHASLDAAAQAHANYLKLMIEETGRIVDPHSETASRPGYTGATVAARVAYANYPGTATESIGGIAGLQTGDGFVDGQMKTIYHAAAYQGGWRDIGIGIAQATSPGPSGAPYTQQIVVINFGVQGAMQWPAAGGVRLYPLDGQTNVIPRFEIEYEIPRPLPELTLAGHPAFFSVKNVAELNTLTSQTIVNAFEMKDSGGNVVPALLMVRPGTNVAGALASARREDGMLEAGNFYLVPTAPLANNATYAVVVSVTTPAGTYTKSWSFTTGLPR